MKRLKKRNERSCRSTESLSELRANKLTWNTEYASWLTTDSEKVSLTEPRPSKHRFQDKHRIVKFAIKTISDSASWHEWLATSLKPLVLLGFVNRALSHGSKMVLKIKWFYQTLEHWNFNDSGVFCVSGRWVQTFVLSLHYAITLSLFKWKTKTELWQLKIVQKVLFTVAITSAKVISDHYLQDRSKYELSQKKRPVGSDGKTGNWDGIMQRRNVQEDRTQDRAPSIDSLTWGPGKQDLHPAELLCRKGLHPRTSM